jgi:1-acyl-sn-glycerol-3-phosphate acyltransferase
MTASLTADTLGATQGAEGQGDEALLGRDDPFDAFGLDQRYYDRWIWITGLYYRWLRVTVDGLENLPAQGPAMLVGNHAGNRLHDASALQYAARRLHPAGRMIRPLAFNGLAKLVLMGHIATQYAGCVVGHPRNAQYLLDRGELVLVYPEGSHSTSKPFHARNDLCPPDQWGSGFVRTALRCDVPVVPVVAHGFETAVPVLWQSRRLGRLWKMPDGVLPVSPQTILTGSFPMSPGVMPFPVRCRLSILPPLDLHRLASGGEIRSEDDVQHVAQAVRSLIKDRLDVLVRHVRDSRRRLFIR